MTTTTPPASTASPQSESPETGGPTPCREPQSLSGRCPDQKRLRENAKRRRSMGDWSSMKPRKPNVPDLRQSGRYAATPRASLGFHEHDSRRLFDEDFLEQLREQRARPANNQASTRRPSLSGQKIQSVPSTRYSFARSAKHLRRRLYWQLAALKEPLHPDGLTKSSQEFLLLIVLGFEIFYVPFALSYLSDLNDSIDYQSTATTINIVVEIVLVVDMMLNLNTAVYEKPSKHSNLITSRKEIIRRYLAREFVAHILGSLPAECITILARANGDTRSLLEVSLPIYVICHVLRFIRLRQVPFLWKSPWMHSLTDAVKSKIETFCGAFHPVLCTVVKLVAGVVVITHYLSCLLRVLNLAEDCHLLPQPTSLSALYTKNLRQVVVGLFGGVKETECGVKDAYCIFLVLLGLVMTAFVVSSVSIAVVNTQTTSHNTYKQSTRVLTSRMEKLKLPKELQGRIHRYSDHMWSEYDLIDSGVMEFTRKLPQPLALDVLLYRYLDLVSGLEFWPECSPDFLSALILCLEVRVFGQDDCILREGEVGAELFMIHRGFVEQTVAGKEVQRLTHGDTFGELALLLDYNRAARVRTVTYVESCVLTRPAFYKVTSRYPATRVRIIVSMLAAGLRSREHPELWQRALQLFESKKAGAGTEQGEGASNAAETREKQLRPEARLSSSEAAEILVEAMHLETGPCVGITAAPTQPHCKDIGRLPWTQSDTATTAPQAELVCSSVTKVELPGSDLRSIASETIKSSHNISAGETHILQVLTSLTKSVRRLEGDLGLTKDELKVVKQKLKERTDDALASVNEASIEMTVPALPARATIYESSPSVSPLSFPAAVSPNRSPATSKVQPRPSRFHCVSSMSNPLDVAANIHIQQTAKHRSSSLSIGDARSSVIAEIALESPRGEDAVAYSSPDSRGIGPKVPRRRIIQRRVSRW